MDDVEGDGDVVPAAAVGRAHGRAVAAAVATARRGFSLPHLSAAEHFADEMRRHEDEYAGAGWGSHFDFCGWNASAAIIMSFSAIEAALDEAEDDLALPAELASAFERAPTLDHVQALLVHNGSTPFNRGTEPFRSADLLRAIRNSLVHPKAEWDDARERNSRLSRRIVSAGLPLSPFQPDPDLAFPHGCMSAGISRWAASSARQFIRELRSRLGLNPTA